jgi:hypothetical protein
MRSIEDNMSCSGPERDRLNQRRVTHWALTWALGFVAVTAAIVRDWLPSAWITITAVAVLALLGFATLLAYRRFLREADELRRKIELEALALAFGVGVIGGLSYWLLEQSGLAPTDESVVVVVVGMMLTHPVAVWLGFRRYR